MPDQSPIVHFRNPSAELRAAVCGEQFGVRTSSPGEVTCFSCRANSKFKAAQRGVDTPTPLKLSGVMAQAPEFQTLAQRMNGKRRFRITVDVWCASEEEAQQVAAERLGPDEDYGFDYQFTEHTVTEVPRII